MSVGLGESCDADVPGVGFEDETCEPFRELSGVLRAPQETLGKRIADWMMKRNDTKIL